MNAINYCPQCGRKLPTDAPAGVCPSCLFQVGLHAPSDPDVTQDQSRGFVPLKPDQVARHFPQLEILDLIGHGGMGAVYKARQRGLDRIVALKILPPEVGRDPSFAERFTREARALARLNHPNIVTIHDSGAADGLYYLVMEYVDGINLRQAFHTGELTPKEALAIVPQICDALQYAHDEGVVHRDIKPENLLLDTKGRVKIADFGLARLLGQADNNFTLTAAHQVMGTPKYMAPEQMEGSHEVDHRADIYSLGVVFYEMLTGELPLGRFQPPSKKVRVDVRLDEVVLRTLEKEPARRYQAARELKGDVETISGLGLSAQQLRQLQRMQGYEYRSQAEVFGWPLVHIATGVDPQTGRKRIARGIIAIGDIAFGVVAIGGGAVGGVAIGGGAVGGLALGGGAIGGTSIGGGSLGLFAFGGCAIGILSALGGLALSFGLAVGGLALGSVAVGGCAIGMYSNAGSGEAYGIHAVCSNVRDAEAIRFFAELNTGLPFTIPLGIMLAVAVTLLIGIVVSRRVLRRASASTHAYEIKHYPAPVYHTDSRPQGCGVAAILILTGGLLFLLLIGAGITYIRVRREQAIVQVAEIEAVEQAQRAVAEAVAQEMSSSLTAVWRTSDRGLELTPFGVTALALDQEQTDAVNAAFQGVHETWWGQSRMQKVTDDRGHQIITIEPMSEAEVASLKDRLWSEVDRVLDVDQQGKVRQTLEQFPLHAELDGRMAATITPGVLGWEVAGLRIEIWKEGQWFHWLVSSLDPGRSSISGQGSGPELPAELQRFWTAAATSEPADATSDPAS